MAQQGKKIQRLTYILPFFLLFLFLWRGDFSFAALKDGARDSVQNYINAYGFVGSIDECPMPDDLDLFPPSGKDRVCGNAVNGENSYPTYKKSTDAKEDFDIDSQSSLLQGTFNCVTCKWNKSYPIVLPQCDEDLSDAEVDTNTNNFKKNGAVWKDGSTDYASCKWDDATNSNRPVCSSKSGANETLIGTQTCSRDRTASCTGDTPISQAKACRKCNQALASFGGEYNLISNPVCPTSGNPPQTITQIKTRVSTVRDCGPYKIEIPKTCGTICTLPNTTEDRTAPDYNIPKKTGSNDLSDYSCTIWSACPTSGSNKVQTSSCQRIDSNYCIGASSIDSANVGLAKQTRGCIENSSCKPKQNAASDTSTIGTNGSSYYACGYGSWNAEQKKYQNENVWDTSPCQNIADTSAPAVNAAVRLCTRTNTQCIGGDLTGGNAQKGKCPICAIPNTIDPLSSQNGPSYQLAVVSYVKDDVGWSSCQATDMEQKRSLKKIVGASCAGPGVNDQSPLVQKRNCSDTPIADSDYDCSNVRWDTSKCKSQSAIDNPPGIVTRTCKKKGSSYNKKGSDTKTFSKQCTQCLAPTTGSDDAGNGVAPSYTTAYPDYICAKWSFCGETAAADKAQTRDCGKISDCYGQGIAGPNYIFAQTRTSCTVACSVPDTSDDDGNYDYSCGNWSSCSPAIGQEKTRTCSRTEKNPNCYGANSVEQKGFCQDESSTNPGGTFPPAAANATLRYTGSSWKADRFLFNSGSAIGIGLGSGEPSSILDINGALTLRGMSTERAPTPAGDGQGRIYFDTTKQKFQISQNGGAYTDLGSDSGSNFSKDSTLEGLVRSTATGRSYFTGGNVGIGTNQPLRKLHVYGDDTQGLMKIENTVQGGAVLEIQTRDTYGQTAINFLNSDNQIDGQISYYPNEQNRRHMTFRTKGEERVRIDSAGKIGINTDLPNARLDIQNGGNNMTGLTVISGNKWDDKVVYFSGNPDKKYDFTMLQDGRVYIGIKPEETFYDDKKLMPRLSVNGIISSSGPAAGIKFFDHEATEADIKNGARSWMWYSTNNTARLWWEGSGDLMTIRGEKDDTNGVETGNVSIGTQNQEEKLNVGGNVNVFGNVSSKGICINGDCKTSWGESDSQVGRVEANETMAREREIANFILNDYHWSGLTGFFVEAYSDYYASGYVKYYIKLGNRGSIEIQKIDARGDIATQFGLKLQEIKNIGFGPKQNNGTTNTSNFKYKLYAQASYYSKWQVVIIGINKSATKCEEAESLNQLCIRRDTEYRNIEKWSGEGRSPLTGNIKASTFDGSVGIGTATPETGYKLDVVGTIQATGLKLKTTPVSNGWCKGTDGVVTCTEPVPQGSSGMTWRGNWDTETVYKKNDAVFCEGNSWIAKIDVKDKKAPPTCAVARGAERGRDTGSTAIQPYQSGITPGYGDITPTLPATGTGVQATTGQTGTNTDPSDGSEYWDKIASKGSDGTKGDDGVSPFMKSYNNNNDIYYTNGNVGIGTVSPGAKIVVAANNANSNDYNYLTFRNLSSGYGTWGFVKRSNNDLSINYGAQNNDTPTAGTALYLKYGGNVGIGETNPKSALTVSGNTQVSGWICAGSENNNCDNNGKYVVNYADGTIIAKGDGGTFKVDKGGAVTGVSFAGSGAGLTGIPWSSITGAPAGSFLPLAGGTLTGSINGGGGNGALRITTQYGRVDIGPQNGGWSHFDTDLTQFYFNKGVTANDGSVGYTFSSYYKNDLKLATGGTPRMTIRNSDGNVGIGTASPDQKLTIKGGGIGFDNNAVDKKLYSPADGDLEWMTHQDAANHGFAISHQGRKWVYLNIKGDSYLNGGNVGIGTTGPSAKLDVVGDLKVSGPIKTIENGNRLIYLGETIISDYWGANRQNDFVIHGSNWDGSGNDNYGNIVGGHFYAYGGMDIGSGSGFDAPPNGLYVAGESSLGSQTWRGDIAWQAYKNINIRGESSFDVYNGGVWGVWNIGRNDYFIRAEYRSDWTRLGLVPSGGSVGIGTMNPLAMLDVNGGEVNVSALDRNLLSKVEPKHTLALARDRIGLDVAELYETLEDVEVGDVLVASKTDRKLEKSSKTYQDQIVGIVSGSPALVFEGSDLKLGSKPDRFIKGAKPPVALSGRVPVKVSLENGAITSGDYLTSSSIPGVAMRATEPGNTVGVALENYAGWGDGTVLVFINIGEKNASSAIKELQKTNEDLQKRLEELEKKVR